MSFVLEINILWAAHQVHHSSEDYNLTTALRQSVVQSYTSVVNTFVISSTNTQGDYFLFTSEGGDYWRGD